MTSSKEKSITTLQNIFENKDSLMAELSLLNPISLDISDMNEFLDTFYLNNPYPNIILYFTPEISAHGGVTAEFDIFKDISNGLDYFCIADINVSNDKEYSFSFLIATNKPSVIFNQEIFVDLSTKDLSIFIPAFFYEYERLKELFTSIANDTRMKKFTYN